MRTLVNTFITAFLTVVFTLSLPVMGETVYNSLIKGRSLKIAPKNPPKKGIRELSPINKIKERKHLWGFSGLVFGADMEAIKMIESSGNPLAYNKKSKAIGLFQITPICLKDYNQYHSDKLTTLDLYNPRLNARVADWYLHQRIPQLLRHYGYPLTDENVLTAFNCGIGCVVKGKLPKETKDYINKYARLKGGK